MNLQLLRNIFKYPLVWLVGTVGLVIVLMYGTTLNAKAIETTQQGENQYNYQYIAMPDFLNLDVGDVRESRFYRKGQPNSINNSYRKAMATILDAVKAENIPDIYITGDLVEGHWGMDTKNTGTFGPVKTYKQRIKAAKRAGNLYYSQWKERFDTRGLTVYPAIGDHEIGDNPWNRLAGKGKNFSKARFNWYTFGKRKDVYSKNILQDNGVYRYTDRPEGQARKTAYATRPHPEVQLITLDVFKKTKNSVIAKLDWKQMQWLKRTLAAANRDQVDWIIVQGHTPIVGPVRQTASSGLFYEGGTNSELWKVLNEYKVDMYLHGEVHAITAHQTKPGGTIQLGCGGLLAHKGVNYATVRLSHNNAGVVVKKFHGTNEPKTKTEYLWQTNMAKAKSKKIYYDPTPSIVGEMSFTKNGQMIERTGLLETYP